MENKLDDILVFLIKEQNQGSLSIPSDVDDKRKLMRALMNVRPPMSMPSELVSFQDSVLKEQLKEKVIIDIDQIPFISKYSFIKLWQGDITCIKADAIVNAANSQLLGCFHPLHGCIDNAIHSAAGIQLRLECNELMIQQGHPEPTGKAKITCGYNLPARHVIHTVGPIIKYNQVTTTDENLLASCYLECLKLADKNKMKSIVFCCISTGEFGFPNKRATEIAVKTVSEYFKRNDSMIETILFNVFKDLDLEIYEQLLKGD